MAGMSPTPESVAEFLKTTIEQKVWVSNQPYYICANGAVLTKNPCKNHYEVLPIEKLQQTQKYYSSALSSITDVISRARGQL